MITPLLTQLTYEGLIDELIGIKNCTKPPFGLRILTHHKVAHTELPASLVTPSNTTSSSTAGGSSTNPSSLTNLKKEVKKKHHLTTSTDPLYAELRDLNFANVGRCLNKVARRLDENYKVCFLFATCDNALYSFILDQSSKQDGRTTT